MRRLRKDLKFLSAYQTCPYTVDMSFASEFGIACGMKPKHNEKDADIWKGQNPKSNDGSTTELPFKFPMG
ncbi:hypothetical protein SDJN02_18131, partial [Cucurbita argyrosperma subsp. argyrosperma]